MKKSLSIICSIFFSFFSTLSSALESPAGTKDGETAKATEKEQKPKKPGFYTESFHILPAIQLTAYSDDNIFATDKATESDVIAIISPTLKISSLWDRHSLSLDTGANIGRYNDNNSEDYEDFWLTLKGGYELGTNSRLYGGAGYNQKHEGRDSKESAQDQTEPTIYYVRHTNLGITHRMNNLTLRAGGTYEALDFDNAGTLSNDERDRTVTGLGLRATQRISKNNRIFLQGLMNRRDYDEATDLEGFQRDSEGYGVGVGMIRTLTGGSKVEAYAGLLSQDYDDNRFDRVTEADFGIDLLWYPAQTLKVTGKLQRSLRETTETGSSGYLYTKLDLQLDKKLFTDVVGYASYGYGLADFQQVQREDDTNSFGIGVKYFMNPHVRLTASFTHYENDSNDRSDSLVRGDTYDFKKNLFMLTVNVRLAP